VWMQELSSQVKANSNKKLAPERYRRNLKLSLANPTENWRWQFGIRGLCTDRRSGNALFYFTIRLHKTDKRVYISSAIKGATHAAINSNGKYV